MAQKKIRLDQLVVQKGLAPSRQRAQALILAGQIDVAGQHNLKAGSQLAEDSEISLRGEVMPFVSRGGLKLQGALDHFELSVEGLCVLDIGQSTGGFTDCLLQRGARHVIGVDVGYGQLAWALRQDPRVTCIERVNARRLDPQAVAAASPEDCWPPTFAVVDVSFISLRLILPAVSAILGPNKSVVALVKPQFEASRQEIGKGGVVRDTKTRNDIIQKVLDWAKDASYSVCGGVDASIAGPKGNLEYLAHVTTPAPAGDSTPTLRNQAVEKSGR